MFNLRKATINDAEFIHECLSYLVSDLNHSINEFTEYLEQYLFSKNNSIYKPEIRIGELQNTQIGILTCNYYLMPRYLGIGCSLEEVVILEKYQGNGYAAKLIKSFVSEALLDKNIRKVNISTDDKVKAGSAYKKVFDETHMVVYAKILNKLKDKN